MLSIGMLVIEFSTSTSKFQIKSDRNTNFTTNNTNNITLSKLNLLQSKSNLEHVVQQSLTSKFQIKSDRNTNFTTNNTNNITLSKLNLPQSKSNLEHVLQQNLMCRYYTNIDLPASNKFDPQYTYRYRHVRVINVPNPKHLCNKDTQVLTAINSAAYYFDRRNAVCSNTFLQSHYGCAHIKPGFVSRTEPEPNPNPSFFHQRTEPNPNPEIRNFSEPEPNPNPGIRNCSEPEPNPNFKEKYTRTILTFWNYILICYIQWRRQRRTGKTLPTPTPETRKKS